MRTQNPQYYSNSLPQVPHEISNQERKFAEKPNALKKVALDDIDDIQTNSISDGGFSWSNMLGKYLSFHLVRTNLLAKNSAKRINLLLYVIGS